MEPGGTLGEHIKEHSKMGIAGSLHIVDNGTFILFIVSGNTLFRIRKADEQFQVPAGVDVNVSM